MSTPTSAYRAKKFPPLCNAVVSRLTPERTLKMFGSWIETAQHYETRYPADWAEVMRLVEKANANRARNEEKDKKEEENDEPTNPGQERKAPVTMLWISEENLVEVEAEVKDGGSYSIQFDCDDYRTRFRMVDGVLMAFEPRYPGGRKVSSSARSAINLTEESMTSTRAALAMCLTDKPEKMGDAIGYMRLIEAQANRASVTGTDGLLRLMLFGLACRLARQNSEVVQIGFVKGGVCVGARDGHDDDEVVQDVMEMCKQLN